MRFIYYPLEKSSSCIFVDQWLQKGLEVHRKIIFPPYEAYDENVFFCVVDFCTVTVKSIQFFSLKEVEQGHFIWLHLRR